MSSRRTESRDLTGDGKVGSSHTSPRAVTVPSRSRHLGTGERNKRKESDANGQERDAEARTTCGKESLPSLCKAASHRKRSYGEEGADDGRSASKGEKERFHIVCSCKLFHLNKNTGMLHRSKGQK